MKREIERLTPEVIESICELVREGAFPRVACLACGAIPEQIAIWFHARNRKNDPYRTLQNKIMRAQAQARAEAEAIVLKRTPEKWLRCGPGRDGVSNDPTIPTGWTEAPSAPRIVHNTILADAKEQLDISLILSALSNFPEAKKAVANAMRLKDAKMIESQPQEDR